MHHTVDPAEPLPTVESVEPAVADVSGMTMLELLESGDSDLVAAVNRLLDHRPRDFLSRWQSFLDTPPAVPATNDAP